MSGFSTFSFCKELWPKQNYTQFIWGLRGHVLKKSQNGVIGSLHACRLRIRGAQRVRDLDKSTTAFYQGRLTTAPRLVKYVYPLYK